jgi:hypothetical protein
MPLFGRHAASPGPAPACRYRRDRGPLRRRDDYRPDYGADSWQTHAPQEEAQMNITVNGHSQGGESHCVHAPLSERAQPTTNCRTATARKQDSPESANRGSRINESETNALFVLQILRWKSLQRRNGARGFPAASPEPKGNSRWVAGEPAGRRGPQQSESKRSTRGNASLASSHVRTTSMFHLYYLYSTPPMPTVSNAEPDKHADTLRTISEAAKHPG